jgi:hypothetical protein
VADSNPQAPPGPRRSTWLLNFGLILLSVSAVLVLAEAALRFTPYRLLLTRDHHLRYYYQADREKGFDIAPNVQGKRLSVDKRVEFEIWSNELGCFDRPYCGETGYILLVGDSFTHSFAPFPDKWGTQMEKLLGCRVLKGGVTGYGTRQELLKAAGILARLPHQPRLIVVGYFWNDVSEDYSFPSLTVVDGFLVDASRYKDPHTNKLSTEKLEKQYTFWERWCGGDHPLRFGDKIRYYLAKNLIVMNLVNDAWVRFFPGKANAFSETNKFLAFQDVQPWSREVWAQHLANLAAFKDLAAAHGAGLLVVLIPTNTQVYPFLADHRGLDLERPNRVLGDFLRARGIDYLDLLPLMRAYANQTPRPALNPDNDLYWQGNSHWSIRGEHLVGLLVSRHILAHQLVAAPDQAARLAKIDEKLTDLAPRRP